MCESRQYFYRPKEAQEKADRRLFLSRSLSLVDADAVVDMVTTIKKLSAKNQSLAHIWRSHKSEFPMSERTFYRHLAEGRFDMTSLELPKKSRYRQRKQQKVRHDQIDFTGRRYADWVALDEEQRLRTVQLDCVEGIKADRQAILTLHFVRLHFQLYLLLPEQNQEWVTKALDALERLCKGNFKKYFPILLPDRGIEFLNHKKLEHSKNRKKRCSVYYCDPGRSDQKGACEKNHVELRKVLPKKTSFEKLDASDMALIMSHVNSYTRESLGGKAPIDLAACVLPKELLEGLGIEKIKPDDVNLTPSLLKLSDRN